MVATHPFTWPPRCESGDIKVDLEQITEQHRERHHWGDRETEGGGCEFD